MKRWVADPHSLVWSLLQIRMRFVLSSNLALPNWGTSCCTCQCLVKNDLVESSCSSLYFHEVYEVYMSAHIIRVMRGFKHPLQKEWPSPDDALNATSQQIGFVRLCSCYIDIFFVGEGGSICQVEGLRHLRWCLGSLPNFSASCRVSEIPMLSGFRRNGWTQDSKGKPCWNQILHWLFRSLYIGHCKMTARVG